MIEPNDIITHLQSYMPAFTDLFSKRITASATSSGSTVTVTSTAHGLAVNEAITVGGGTFENAIVSVVDNGDGSLRFETTDDHDLTEPKLSKDPKNITLSGINVTWNGEHEIISIPNRRHFEIDFPTGITLPPTITTAQLVESREAGIVGAQIVATVPDANTFTFISASVPSFPTGALQNLSISSGVRISGAESIVRAEAFYTAQNTDEAWMFVIMNDADVSKDRNTLNDGVATFTPQNFGKQTILQNFFTVVYLPTDSNDAAGVLAQNKFYGEIYRVLVNVMYGFFFPDPDTQEKYVTVSNGHGNGVQNTAYTSHIYDWQIPTVISFENGFIIEPNVAFRDIISSWGNMADDEAVLSTGINLDEEAL